MDQQSWEVSLFALVLWREARGETVDTKRVIAWTIKNRVLHPSWYGTDWSSVITKPEQYSSMTHSGDPNLVKWPLANDTSWMACMDIAAEVYGPGGVDLAQGATHYYDSSMPAPPYWAEKMTLVSTQGRFHLYKQNY